MKSREAIIAKLDTQIATDTAWLAADDPEWRGSVAWHRVQGRLAYLEDFRRWLLEISVQSA